MITHLLVVPGGFLIAAGLDHGGPLLREVADDLRLRLGSLLDRAGLGVTSSLFEIREGLLYCRHPAHHRSGGLWRESHSTDSHRNGNHATGCIRLDIRENGPFGLREFAVRADQLIETVAPDLPERPL